MTTSAALPVPVVALIPLRGAGKSRLASAIPPGSRQALVAAMLDDVLAAVRGAGVEDVRMLAGDALAAELATARGLPSIPDPTPTSEIAATVDDRLRRAVDGALVDVDEDAVRLVIAADLPRLTAVEVTAVLAAPSDVVVVPTAGGGTAMLRLAPRVIIPARYGVGSAEAHLQAARASGWSRTLLDLPGARHDVDAVADLTALEGTSTGSPPGPSTTAFLRRTAGYPPRRP